MHLKEIQLVNFKNYSEETFTFCPGINAIHGKNGIGKTNLLDAIHYLSLCKSYYSASDQQNIRHEMDFFALHGLFQEEGIDGVTQVSCIQRRNSRKVFKINQKEYERLSDHIGRFPSVMISPYDQDYIQGGSELRRKYFDSVISQYDHVYLDSLIQYNKILLQRNALLKQAYDSGHLDSSALEIWDDRLVLFGKTIYETRRDFIHVFMPVFLSFYRQLSEEDEVADIRYESQLETDSFDQLLREALQRDYHAAHTTCGVHKDDFLFMLNGFPVRRFGSQGQQKTFLIALKLAQFDYLEKRKSASPLLLLDDVFDKLDYRRIRCLIQLVSQSHFGQVFLTDTQQDRLEGLCRETGVDFQSIALQEKKLSGK